MADKRQEIQLSVEGVMATFIDNLEKLSECGIDYISCFDQYMNETVYDATLIKERLKDVVIRGMDND